MCVCVCVALSATVVTNMISVFINWKKLVFKTTLVN